MHYTNKANLPAPLESALRGRERGRRDLAARMSVTDLVKSPRQRILTDLYWPQLETDVSENLWLLFGNAIHETLHAHAGVNALSEEKLEVDIDTPAGKTTIVGVPDYYDAQGTVWDWKTTSTWAFRLGDKPEWTVQLNAYAWMLRMHGFDTSALRIGAILRDWSATKAKHDSEYPQVPVHVQPVEMWSDMDASSWVHMRAAVHLAAIETWRRDNTLDKCTAEERWAKPDVWAVRKRGTKRALPGGLCKSPQAADEFAASKSVPTEVDFRRGESVRCASYCAVGGATNHCEQWCAIRGAVS